MSCWQSIFFIFERFHYNCSGGSKIKRLIKLFPQLEIEIATGIKDLTFDLILEMRELAVHKENIEAAVVFLKNVNDNLVSLLTQTEKQWYLKGR